MHFASEPGLRDAFAGLTGDKEGVTVEEMAGRIAVSLNKVSRDDNELKLHYGSKWNRMRRRGW